MRRTLYIGLGGTGIKVIDEVKKQIISTHGNVPPLIKFLGIDVDIHTLKNTTLESSEQLLVQDRCALNRYIAYQAGEYNDFPSKNAAYLHEITTQYGSGAFRSNASFLFMAYSCKFEQKISYILAELCNALYGIGTQIDVHLCLSLCGGFGSGSYLEISKLIKERIQGSNIIIYAFSHKFFMHVGVNRNLKPNCYASLLEADYLINEVSAGNIVTPFDSLYYINNQIDDYIIDFDSAKKSLVQILSLAPYGIHQGFDAINDAIIHAMNSGMFDINLKSRKKAWVSSLGVSGLCYPRNEYENDQKAFIKRAVLHQLIYQNNSQLIGDFLSNTQSWFLFTIENNAVLNQIIPSNDISFGGVRSLLVFNPQNAEVDDVPYKQQWPCYNIRLDTVVGPLVESFSRFLRDSINDLLFQLNEETCGLNVLHSALSQLRDLTKETIDEIQSLIDVSKDEYQRQQLIIKQIQSDYFVYYRRPIRFLYSSLLQEFESDIIIAHEKLLKIEVEIKRLCYAKEYHSQILKIIENTIWSTENTRNHLLNILKEADVALNIIPNSDLFINVRHSGFGLLQRQCERLSLSVWEGLRNAISINLNGELFNTDVLMNHIQELQLPDCSIETIISEMQDTELDYNMTKVIHMSAPMLTTSPHGHAINLSSFDYLIIPQRAVNLEARLLGSLHRVGYNGTPQIIQVINADHILLFRQYGVIPPYFIEGILEDTRGGGSCESEFKKVIESGRYSPFSRQSYEDAVKNGFSLRSSRVTE